ncbi:RES family NAD+ phosphorylase [[Erwinia] mediterraneensis]|uniref:RES family NAD+ phosphorylase n=1 Tax=[Erwinia] mediterraneensis TaxID=2161819 RepID=UPI001030A8EA|nr:RES domain-containing protein [[Erwinia] mediterraneensis]
MIFYRLTKTAWAQEAWTGNGAKWYGGRWNHKGSAAVYVSTSIALASLEILVHLQKESLLEHYALFTLEVPDTEVQVLENRYLPEDWRADPAPVSTMDLGSGWLESNSSLALIVPSSIIPQESNALLNPQHPAFTAALKTVQQHSFSFDPRLLR